jgi:hypothetical protein
LRENGTNCSRPKSIQCSTESPPSASKWRKKEETRRCAFLAKFLTPFPRADEAEADLDATRINPLPASPNEEENQLDFVTQSKDETNGVLKLCKFDSGHSVAQLETPEDSNVKEERKPRDYYYGLTIHMDFMIQTVTQEKKEKEAVDMAAKEAISDAAAGAASQRCSLVVYEASQSHIRRESKAQDLRMVLT